MEGGGTGDHGMLCGSREMTKFGSAVEEEVVPMVSHSNRLARETMFFLRKHGLNWTPSKNRWELESNYA